MVGEATHGTEAVRLMRALRPDVVFLDVEMPGLDGFGVLERAVADARPVVVFLTAHDEYAVRAFAVDAVDYLMKPLTRARFDACMERVARACAIRDTGGPAERDAAGILVRRSSGDRILMPEEIDWIEAADYYSVLHVGPERFLHRVSLRSLFARLPGHLFVRTHRSAIVNLARVERFTVDGSGTANLILRTGAHVPVSRRRRSAVRRRLAELGGGSGAT